MNKLLIKRIYEEPLKSDGIRILIDRLWPRGISKDEAHLDYWFKEIAPSTKLREWFNHQPDRFEEFSKKYISELKNNEYVDKIRDLLKKHNVTLIFAAKDLKFNHAVVLQKFIQ